jgi:proteasome accessory factor B
MSEQLPLVRKWRLLCLLSARRHGLTIQEIVDALRVADKTVRRNLETFSIAGFPLTATAGPSGCKTWRLEASQLLSGLTFTFEESLALYLSRRFLEPLAGTVLWQAARSASCKIRAGLQPSALKYVEKFAAIFRLATFGVCDYSKQGELIERLTIAIEDRRATSITYQSLHATEPMSYRIHPLGLAWHRASLYLVGHSPRHDGIRHWKVNRIQEVEPTNVQFQRPDGSLLAAFDLDCTEEIKQWLLSFGRHAVVLEPERLRDEMTREVSAMLQQYETTKKSGPLAKPAK